jgi:hypothetical protein
MISRVFVIVVVGVLVAGVAAALITTATFEHHLRALQQRVDKQSAPQLTDVSALETRIYNLEQLVVEVADLRKRVTALEEQMTIRLEPVPPKAVPRPLVLEPEISDSARQEVMPAIVDPPLPPEKPVKVKG